MGIRGGFSEMLQVFYALPLKLLTLFLLTL